MFQKEEVICKKVVASFANLSAQLEKEKTVELPVGGFPRLLFSQILAFWSKVWGEILNQFKTASLNY